MSPNYKVRKVSKKQRRCEAIIQEECGIKRSDVPTRVLAILNAGHCTGLTEEDALAAASAHGGVVQLIIVPHKSYSFLECESIEDAKKIYHGMHNVARIGQNGAVAFLAYFEKLPSTLENIWHKPLPAGLLVLPDFITEKEEHTLLAAVAVDNGVPSSVLEAELKHRRVKHFGYEFMYDINNVDPNNPLERKIPRACDFLWPRLQTTLAKMDDVGMSWETPDQLTVNEYEPGQGIPPHVDTHSAFLDPILSLSLHGDVVMEFRRGIERVPVLLRRRSLVIMSGQSRYDWTHGITPRILDVVPTAGGTLTTQVRTKRISLTFRRLRRAPCDCAFPTLCDTQLQCKTKETSNVTDEVALRLEQINVHSVYEHIASHFSDTRHTPWPQVAAFLSSFPAGSVLLDVGCGNGKYLKCNGEALAIGCDRSRGLLGKYTEKAGSVGSADVFRCDCIRVPIRSASIDGCVSIAVIHHLATVERRLAAIREISRLLRKNGRALVYVWAKNQHSGNKKSSYLLQNKSLNTQKVTIEQQRQQVEQDLQQSNSQAALELPIHTNRTDFLQQDVLVPWKLKGKPADGATKPNSTYLRYYHVFEEQELEQLVAQVPEIRLVHSYYDQGNHCVIFERQ